MDRIPKLEQRLDGLEDRVEKMEDRQDKFEENYRLHREEFIETRSYVKQSYQKLDEIRLGINSLEKTTGERIEQQARYYRDELKGVQEQLRHAETRANVAEKEAASAKDKGEGGGQSKQTYDFAWKVIAGVLALATTILGLLQVSGGGTNGQ